MSSTGVDRIDQLLQAGIQAARASDPAAAQPLLRQVTELEPDNVQAWLWLAYVVAEIEAKRAALWQAQRLRPADARVRQALKTLLGAPQVRRAARSGVFISYARADDLFAITLTESLRAAGLEVWLDITDMTDDTTWHSAIFKALRRSGVMLVLLSPAAVESDDMRVEREWFHKQGKIVLPVLYRDCDYLVDSFLLPPLDFRDDYDKGLRRLYAQLGVTAPP
jgi:hypothetical protein